METETPLDVLSRAASLVDNNEVRRSTSSSPISRSFNNDKQTTRTVCERSASFSSSAKELPTKILKQRRKDRRNADYLSAKLRTQRSLDSQTLVRLGRDPASSDDDSVPSYSSGTLDLDDLSPHEDDDDNDMPLDMTTTNRQTPTEIVGNNSLGLGPSVVRRFYARPTIQIGPDTAQQQHRPSVIKCASALVEHNQGRNHHSTKSDADKVRGSEMRRGHRREVLSGMCDPVIDEHFRRSLGKDYPEYFSTPSVPNTVSVSGLSVDDHFAKALGDTWLRLQKSNRSDSGTSAGSSSSLSPPPSPPLVPQLHVVST